MTHTKVTAVIIRHLNPNRPVTHAVKNFDISDKSKEETVFEIKEWFEETVNSHKETFVEFNDADYYLDVIGTITNKSFKIDF